MPVQSKFAIASVLLGASVAVAQNTNSCYNIGASGSL